jgi:uncharacterized protein YbjT (DUF2867 family)
MRIKLIERIISVIVILVMTACSSQNAQMSSSIDVGLTLVTGITGNQGGGVAGALLEEGYAVRGMTRNPDSEASQHWSDLGAEMVYGDFTDQASIDAALEGVDYLFINLQEQIPDYINATKYLLDAANAAGVRHILYSSNRRSEPELPQSASKTEVELYLRESGYSYTTLRIPQMMSNFVRERDMANVLRNGIVGRGSEQATFAYFSPDDLGPMAVAAIEDTESWNGREINLAGDELTDRELASLLGEISGLNIEYASPEQQEARWLANQGLSYDTEQLRAEFPGMKTLRDYLITNNYGEKLKAMSMQPLPPEQSGRGGPPPR